MTAASPALLDQAVAAVTDSGMYRPAVIRRAVSLMLEGAGVRETSRVCQISHNTTAKIRSIVVRSGFMAMCGCGRRADHRGLCKPRAARLASSGYAINSIATVINFLTQRDVEIRKLGADLWLVDKHHLTSRGLIDKANRIRSEMRLAPYVLRAE